MITTSTVVVVPTRRTPPPAWVLHQRHELGQNIAEQRRQAGLSQDRLAERIGMERRSIQRYEAGERDPTYGDLLLIADALGVDLERLMKRTPAGG
ncbi:helix-turn-helix domain-containing protein [Streptomyces cinereoruber]|uniref:helix-turn-helix domain-containing protein n=1 Tax=Streptomyces cinereoruber TaxID=67260 RepID=UPI0036414471